MDALTLDFPVSGEPASYSSRVEPVEDKLSYVRLEECAKSDCWYYKAQIEDNRSL